MAREREEALMRDALALAARAEGRTAPNPMVGAIVLDRRGRVVGQGWHRRAGAAHAEAEALRRAGTRAAGGTLIVTLEPCRHTGRTPPCAPAVAAAGVARVVIGAKDPVPGHGGGAAWLARRGIDVETGILRGACEEQNRAWLTAVRAGRPWMTLKAAMTLDGKVATWRGESRWITGESARGDGHRLRNTHDAVLVGVGTVLADDPRLTVRGVAGGRDPVRVVVDSSLRTPLGAALFKGSGGRVVIATTARALPQRARRLEFAGAEVWRVPARGGRVDLAALAKRLAASAIHAVLVEGGPGVHGSLLDAGLADELRLYLAPAILGGTGRKVGATWSGGAGTDRLKDARRMRLTGEPRRLGDDLLLVYRSSDSR